MQVYASLKDSLSRSTAASDRLYEERIGQGVETEEVPLAAELPGQSWNTLALRAGLERSAEAGHPVVVAAADEAAAGEALRDGAAAAAAAAAEGRVCMLGMPRDLTLTLAPAPNPSPSPIPSLSSSPYPN